jgi:predicted tellurium resistance membrane protein TerC
MDTLIKLFMDPATWIGLLALIVMEIVLGIDNLVFISILTNKLPTVQQKKTRRIGISLALLLRLALLGTVAFIVHLVEPVIELFGRGFSWRDFILIAGGLFLVWKATKEIHHAVDKKHEPDLFDPPKKHSMAAAIGQILVIDMVFSVDSIITAVGMTPHLPIMILAVITAVLTMMVAAEPLSRFIRDNPTIVMLALGFLIMIGMTLIAEGFGVHTPKAYVYTAMAFSGGVETLNLLSRRSDKQKGHPTARD